MIASEGKATERKSCNFVKNMLSGWCIVKHGMTVITMNERDNFERVGLSTKDKQGFYEHLGYIKTDKAITAMGSTNKFLSGSQLSGLQSLFGGKGPSKANTNTWYRKELQ
mmetsp:Transcript_18386/g.23290  ORF Transcript_18386/g.23290 Transcript_18386/m.23290 type:complete len:110 (-) Transcript_18386:86-415(-)